MAKKSYIRSILKKCVVLGLAGALFVSAGQVVWAQEVTSSEVSVAAVSSEAPASAESSTTEAPASADDEDDQSAPEPTPESTSESASEITQEVSPVTAPVVAETITETVVEPVVEAAPVAEIAESAPEIQSEVQPEVVAVAAALVETVVSAEVSTATGSVPPPVVGGEVAVSAEVSATTLGAGGPMTEIAISPEVSATTLSSGGPGSDPEIAISGEYSFTTLGNGGPVTEIAVSGEYSFTTLDGDDDDDGPGGGGGGRRRRSPPRGEVLGEVLPCGEWLSKYIRYGWNNDPFEVLKLQYFLRTFEGFEVGLTGVYDEPTLQAVMIFQRRYSDDVLNPWGLSVDQPTGFVFITTKLAINNIYCNRSTDTDLDLRHIYDHYGPVGLIVDKEGAGNYVAKPVTVATSTWEYAPEPTRGWLGAAAVGLLDFIKDKAALLFIMALAATIAVLWYLLMHSYKQREDLAEEYYSTIPPPVVAPEEEVVEVRVRDEEISAADLNEPAGADRDQSAGNDPIDKK